MTPEEIAFAEAALEAVESEDGLLSDHQWSALLTAARYGVKVANNYRTRGPRLHPRNLIGDLVNRWSE